MLVHLVYLVFSRLRSGFIAIVMFGPAIVLADISDARRMALVIGNSKYEYVTNIPNSANDARDIAAALGRISFNVTELYDLDYRQMRLALRDFSDKAAKADVVLVYFAGHGIEIDNTNYLIPTNAELKSDKDVEFEAIRLDSVLNAVSTAKGLKLVLIDACRNNPFLSDMERTTATRSIGQGLGSIDPGGVLVGYSARGGTLALDGDGRNSPYAEALLEHIEVPGLELGKLFRKVRDTVFELTDGYQEPFTYGSLPGRDIYLVPAAVSAPSVVQEASKVATDPVNERQSSAERVLREALTLADETTKQNALKLIAQLYPDTRAGQYAQGVLDAASSTNRNPATHVAPKTTEEPLRQDVPEDKTAARSSATSNTEANLNLSRGDYRNIQRGLNVLGFAAGPEDGIFGPRSRAALERFQSKNGVARTGYLTAESVAVLSSIPQPERQEPVQKTSRGQTLVAPEAASATSAAIGFNGEYVVNIRRRPDPLGTDAGSGIDTVLWLKYRKTDAGFALVNAVDRSKGGDSRSKKYRASLSDKGRLKVSGRTNFLFNSVYVVPFSVTLDLPSTLAPNASIRSNQGRFDKNWYVDVVVTRK
ncbi:caspase family protein [Ruegeria sp. SCSIO 43209]|uniref:caspase family protein n=1 Tax=Ruegeria sp. SCSIO 43209 TaxID=2793010 RepID=UPI001CA92D64|nr:caspase family protein [Ruegeria sp. SCSIO 43209]UAB88242.1 caspase family protein [Ruegeria sp. SCSIO 43209]